MKRVVIALAFCMFAPFVAYADTIVAGYSFDDNAFADQLVSSTGTWQWYNNLPTADVGGTPAQLESQLVGSDINSHAFCSGGVAVCTLNIAFTNNVVINGTGADLAVFELGGSDTVTLVIGGITRQYSTSLTGLTYSGPAGHVNNINVALINLDDFGIAALGSVSSLQAQATVGLFGYSPTYTVFGALNSGPASVPEPSIVVLLGFGLAGVGLLARKRRVLHL